MKGGEPVGWKCVPQVTGLVRGEPKPGAKHRAPGVKICMEAGTERASKSKTLDRARSKYNGYWGCKSGADCWAAMEQAADEYRVTGTDKRGKEFSRKLRADAVIGWAVIFNPPEAVAADWDEATKKKFRDDSWRVMEKIEPRLFRNSNVRMIARHRDEDGDHDHVIGDARDEAGRYCGNLIDAKFYERVNLEYPALMRRLGWDIEDAEITDWQRYTADPEYQAAVDAKRAAGPGGLSVNDYMASQAAARADAAAEMYQEARQALQEAQRARSEAQKDRDEVKAMLGRTRGLMGSGEAYNAELAARRGRPRRMPGE